MSLKKRLVGYKTLIAINFANYYIEVEVKWKINQ
jgi:hypothetical protein